MVYNLNKNRARCPSCVVLLWLNYVRMSATYEAVNNTLYKLFTRDPRSPTLERQIRRPFYQNKLMFQNFGVGSDGEFVFYSHIYFSFFDCEVKLVFHVIKCHSYKFRTCSYIFVHE